MATVLTNLEQATAEWLTGVLREAGILAVGQVTAVERGANAAFNSSVAHLSVQYSPDAPSDAPEKLFLKLNRAGWGENEIALYRLAQPMADRLPMLPRFYAGEYDPESQDSYLLLADLSQTHIAPLSREQALRSEGVPEEAYLLPIIEALAGFHAAFWEQPDFGQAGVFQEVRWYGSPAAFQAHLERRQGEVARFVAEFGATIPADWLALLTTILAKFPRLWQRYIQPRLAGFRQITMSQGDCYLTQFLCPKNGIGQTYLCDFQDAGPNFGPFDLVYIIANFWTPQQRHYQGREERLLRHYLTVLHQKGVQNYTWDDLLTDYRLSLAFIIFGTVWDAVEGSGESYWRPKLACQLANFQDLGGLALLD